MCVCVSGQHCGQHPREMGRAVTTMEAEEERAERRSVHHR